MSCATHSARVLISAKLLEQKTKGRVTRQLVFSVAIKLSRQATQMTRYWQVIQEVQQLK